MEDNRFAEGYAIGRDTNNYGGGYGGGFGYGGDWIWIIFLFALFGGWGGGFGGGFGNNALGYDFPWLLNGQNAINNNTNSGFRDAALSGKLDAISTQLCNNATNALQTAYENQIAGMNQSFAMQQAFNNCCCENRLGTADLKATVISENCADREALSNGIRDIIASNTHNTQLVLDKLCQQEIDAKNDQIQTLRTQLNMANLAASQTAQTADIRASQNATLSNLLNELRSCPIPATPVFGSQPIFTCPNNNSGCGCGCGNNF